MFIRKKELEEIKKTIQDMKNEIDLLKYPRGRIEIAHNDKEKNIYYIYNNYKYKIYSLRDYTATLTSFSIIRKDNKVYISLVIEIIEGYSFKHIINKYLAIDENGKIHETNSDWQIQF